MMGPQSKERVSRLLVCFACVVFPFELVLMQGAHAILSDHLPFPVAFLHPSILALYFAFFLQVESIQFKRLGRVPELSIALIAGPPAIHVLNGGLLDAQFLFLAVSAIILGLYISHLHFHVVLRSICLGVLLWGVVVILLWSFDAILFLIRNEWARNYGLDQLILAMRYPESIEGTILYPFAVGNWNKAANILVLGAMMFLALGMHDHSCRRLTIWALPVISLALIISFSRGGILVIATLGLLVALWSFLNGRRQAQHLFYCVMWMLVPLLATIASDDMRSAWVDMSSTESRIRQISDISDTVGGDTSLASILIGAGVGSYGEQIFGYSFAGTHNLFIDTFLAGGVTQLLGVLILLLYPISIAVKLWQRGRSNVIGGLSLLGVFVLSLREFDLSYLGVSVLPSFLVGCFASMAIFSKSRSSPWRD